jgi:flagellar protein FlbT
MHITLRANEKIYINGAVLRADRKVSLELMNDAVFLLENHIMQEKDATTPLRQWYFIVQMMLMEGAERPANRDMFDRHGAAMASAYGDIAMLEGLARVAALVERRRYFEALKTIRSILPLEDSIMNPAPALAEAS